MFKHIVLFFSFPVLVMVRWFNIIVFALSVVGTVLNKKRDQMLSSPPLSHSTRTSTRINAYIG